ncbi:putative cytochrome [Zancudomyces culisetae]|uniref:Putative cytochrome n=1 Tax=Zancudomyces culisetae TaxID=1213189 RepID=A0A1R1PNI7_ZANCU|nr:putative cytochrome [Zancudomyces culisetae]|eukprot:OMH82518.1 putative cytochrome [Zancudomyces culisetae]
MILRIAVGVTARRFNVVFVTIASIPYIYNELLLEQISIVKKFGPKLKFEHLSEMKVLDSVILESLRLNVSSTMFPRYTKSEYISSSGTCIPKDVYVGINVLTHNRNPKIFGKNASFFDHKRFLKDNCSFGDVSTKNLNWGVGPRMCLAKDYAVAICKMLFAILIRNYKFSTMTKPIDINAPFPRNLKTRSPLVYFTPHPPNTFPSS